MENENRDLETREESKSRLTSGIGFIVILGIVLFIALMVGGYMYFTAQDSAVNPEINVGP